MGWIRAGGSAGWVLAAAIALGPAGASAQMSSAGDVWQEFYGGCAQRPGNEYLCACAATEFVSRCQRAGSHTPDQIGRCMGANQDAWIQPVVAACQDRRHLRTGGSVTPARPMPVQGAGPTMTRADVWNAAFEGCTRPGRNPQVPYTCACVATYAADACAPQADVPISHVRSCIRAVSPDITRVTPQCASFGSLQLSGGAQPPLPNAAPAAAPADPAAVQSPPPPRPQSVRSSSICRGVRDGGPGAMRFCRQVVDAIASDDSAGFLALIALPDVAYHDRAGNAVTLRPAALESMIVRAGGLWRWMNEGVQLGWGGHFGDDGPFSPRTEQPYDSFEIGMNHAAGWARILSVGQVGGSWRIVSIAHESAD